MVGACGIRPRADKARPFVSACRPTRPSHPPIAGHSDARVSEESPFLELPAAVCCTIYSARSRSHKTPCKYEVSTFRNSAATRSRDFASVSLQSVVMPFTI